MQARLRRIGSVATIASALLLGGFSLGSAHAAGASIKVVVNGEPVTTTEIAERARLLRLTNHMSGASVDRMAMEELVDERLKVQEAKRVGVEVSDAQVEQAFAGIAAHLKISPAQLAQGLASQGVSAANLKARIRTQILWQQLVVSRFNRTVNISDSQIVDALSKKQNEPATGGKNKAAAKPEGEGTTAEYTLQQVILAVSKERSPEARMREAEALRAKVTSCDGLVDLVKAIPESMVKPLGKRTEDEMPEVFRGLLADVPVGHLSKPNRTQLGIEMAAVCEKRELKGDFQVRSKVEEELRTQEGEVFARRYINDLRRIAVIDYRK